MSNSIVTVVAQHGNERFGVLVGFELLKLHQEVIFANPEAFLRGARYIEQDMNRSYQTQMISLEQSLAQTILRQVQQKDIVLDIHTSAARVGRVAIVRQATKPVLQMVASLGFTKVAVMPRSIVRHALIGNVGLGISLEFGSNTVMDQESAQEIAKRIANMCTPQSKAGLDVYYVRGLLDKKHRNTGLRNYKYTKAIGGYPFLVGESRYKDYAGFFADRKEKVIIGGNDD